MIKEFAEYFSLTIWDWFTAAVAVTSLIVAICAFVVAMKTYSVSKQTLASQIQTELNTTPPINIFIQEFLIKKFLSSLFLAHIEMKAIWHVIKENNYMYHLPISITENLLLPKDNIHRELFYEDESSFREFNDLYNEIDKYNSNIKAINEFAKEKTNKNYLDAIFEQEDKITKKIVYLYIMIMNDEFHYSKEKMTEPIYDTYGPKRDFKIILPDDGKTPKYFNNDDPFFLLKTEEFEDKTSFIGYMDGCVKSSMEVYSKYLIKIIGVR